MMEDPELLRRYAEHRDEAAFAELVRRHVDFVYAAALRRVNGDAHLAQDVTQQVFTALARQAGALAHRQALAGWLFLTTRNAAAEQVRAEQRRRRREQKAESMNNLTAPLTVEPEWERLRPALDRALDGLRDDDREAVLLRFFAGKSFAEIGGQLQLTENAARMRVERALGRMQAALATHGVTSTTAALAIALAQAPAIAVPAGLAASVTGAALAGAGSATLGTAVFMGMTKLQIGIAAAVALAGTTGLLVQANRIASLRAELAQVESQSEGARTAPSRLDVAAARLAADTDRASRVEIERLHREAEALRGHLTSLANRVAEANAPRKAAPPFTGPTFEANQVDIQAKAVYQERPLYPAELRRVGIGGEALIDFVVDPEGKVRNARVLAASHDALGTAALTAVEKWEFDAAQKGGLAVAMHTQVPIKFTFREESATAPKASGKAPSSPAPVRLWF